MKEKIAYWKYLSFYIKINVLSPNFSLMLIYKYAGKLTTLFRQNKFPVLIISHKMIKIIGFVLKSLQKFSVTYLQAF